MATRHTELRRESADMCCDRTLGKHEILRDLSSRAALGQSCEDGPLPIGEDLGLL
jgi:hypothetical protein